MAIPGAILGVSDSHNAAAALITPDGTLTALQEERPTRVKNFFDTPRQAIGWLLDQAGIRPDAVEQVALCNTIPLAPLGRAETIAYYRGAGAWQGRARDLIRATPIARIRWRQLRERRFRAYESLGFRAAQLRAYDHHECHAATAYHGRPMDGPADGPADGPVLVVTCDGAGDLLCATVGIGQDGAVRRLYSVDSSHSIGTLFAVVTYMTGMVPNEHEYKLMGMAPYASATASRRVRDRLLALFDWDPDGAPRWRRRPGVPHAITLQRTLERVFFEERFDAVMGGAQLFVEAMLRELVRRAVRATGLRRVHCAGGVFMNVKANKLLMELDEVEDLYVFPSCGDETTAIGAAYLARAALHGAATVPPLRSAYLGPEWPEAEIAAAIAPLQADGRATIERPDDLNDAVLRLLLGGEVVGRFAGREEFGARSLGNRAILADPRDPAVIQVINDMIKSRDFWMPFASSVLDEAAPDYLVNPKQIAAPHMILSFDTTPAGAAALRAGVHPYDRTCRPQVVTRAANPEYWDLIARFRDATGVGGLLNTSLNLHGLPLVHHPRDAVEVLLRSGLRRLAIGPFLVTKNA